MNFSDLIHETYTALAANRARTALTMLGIVIGIASVIAMVSIGQGAQNSIEERIQSIGSNLIQIMPGAQGGPGFQVSQGRGSARTLTQDDAEAIGEKISGVAAVSPELSNRYQVTGQGANTNTSVVGVTAVYPDVRNLKLTAGSFISDQHLASRSRVAVLGPTVKSDLFGEETEVVGKTIRVNGLQFKIIGLTEAKGGSGFGSQDDMIFIPLSSAQKFLAGDDYVTGISVQAAEADDMTEIVAAITALLRERHRIAEAGEADFNILNQNDLVETASSVTQTFTILLGAVAGISLVVGGIGIMNMMLTTVTERTREIGLRKAIGAKRRDISRQFLAEAIALTMIGGLAGIVLGSGASLAISWSGLIETKISLGSIFLATSVSAGIGIVFGYYPARRAAALNPIEALRYE